MSRILEQEGFITIAEDLHHYEGADPSIKSGADFFHAEPPRDAAAIVTNPPYRYADDFIRKGLGMGLPVIVLLRLMAIEGASRSDLVDQHCVRIWAGIERLPSMLREGYTGPRLSSSAVPFAWFVFEPQKRLSDYTELRRMSWRTKNVEH
jgi:hypothetical protein